MDTSRQNIDLAMIWWRQDRLLKGSTLGPSEQKKLQREVDRLHRTLQSNKIEVNDFTGQHAENLNVDAIAIEPDSTVETELVYETIAPEIVIQDQIIQRSRVIIHVPAPNKDQRETTPQEQRLSGSEASQPPLDVERKRTAVQTASTNEQQAKPDHHQQKKDSDFALTEDQSRKRTSTSLPNVLVVGSLLLILALMFVTLHCLYDMSKTMSTYRTQLASIETSLEDQSDSGESQAESLDETEMSGEADTNESDRQSLVIYSYTVNAGDTLSSICASQDLDESAIGLICTLNGIDDPDRIYEGQTLYLPSAEGADRAG